MEEYKEVMGSDWAEGYDNFFENLSPQQAIDKLQTVVQIGGDQAILDDPKSLQLIRSIANITDNEIAIWVRKWVPYQMPLKDFDKVDEMLKDYRKKCRASLKLDPYKTTIN